MTMSIYRAPLDEMRFVLHELAGLDAVATLPGFADTTLEMVDSILEEANRFAAGILAPLNAVGDREGAQCRDGVVTMPTGFVAA